MTNMSNIIFNLREEYLSKGLAKDFQEINCGQCVDFADEVESLCWEASSLSNDHFILEREDSDGWNGDEQDKWDEDWLKHYGSLPPEPYTVKDLTDKIKGYHCWIYFEGKHYDAECPEGVANMFDLPFFQRYLKEEEEDNNLN